VNPISLNRIYNEFPSLVDVCKSLSKDLIIGIIISTPENIKLPLLSGNLVLFKINSQTTSDDEVYDIRKSGRSTKLIIQSRWRNCIRNRQKLSCRVGQCRMMSRFTIYWKRRRQAKN
jgi:hypothetical protein